MYIHGIYIWYRDLTDIGCIFMYIPCIYMVYPAVPIYHEYTCIYMVYPKTYIPCIYLYIPCISSCRYTMYIHGIYMLYTMHISNHIFRQARVAGPRHCGTGIRVIKRGLLIEMPGPARRREHAKAAWKALAFLFPPLSAGLSFKFLDFVRALAR